jgi:hypothetical protein
MEYSVKNQFGFIYTGKTNPLDQEIEGRRV